MTYHTHVEEVRAIRAGRERVSNLVSRYPGLTREERDEVLTFLRTGRHLDIGLLTSNQQLKPKLDAFMADHHSQLRVKWTEAAALIGGIVAFAMIAWLLWEAFT